VYRYWIQWLKGWSLVAWVLLTRFLLNPIKKDGEMTEKKNWQLQPGVNISPELGDEVAKVACALKSLSAYTTFAMEREDCPEDLQQIVEEGLDAMAKIFVW
jgi:hypothetical protein